MKRFRVILLSCVIVITLLFSGTAYAQIDEELPSLGITPDSSFYFIDIWGKKIGLFFTFGAEAKATKALQYAEERLAEAQVMADRNKPQAVTVATDGYDEYTTMAVEKMVEASEGGVDISEVSELVALATAKHLFVLDGVMDIVPEEAREAVAQARGVSINGLGDALRALAGENPEIAMEINLDAIEDRLNRARAKAEDNDIEGLEIAVEEFVALSGFGEEISAIAQGLGEGTTTVDELVARATSIHLEVLAEVYEKVPEQAKPAIEGAMSVSVMGHERAVEALEEAGALGDIPEELPIPEGIPDEVKQRILTPEVERGRAQSLKPN